MNNTMKRAMTIGTMMLALVAAPDLLAQGNSGNAPGNSGDAPGNSGDAPGNSGDAPGNSGNAPGQSGDSPGNSGSASGKKTNQNLGHGNASNGVMAIIHANRHVLYAGEDALEVSVRFPRGAELLTGGEVDAHLVVFGPDAIWDVLALDEEGAGNGNGNLFQLAESDVEALAAGVYQLGVVLTVPGGDPFALEDWFNGMLGLLAVQGLTIAEEPIEEDADEDGFIDDDSDGDGLSDGEEESTDDSTGDDAADDTDDSTTE
jgi:hypothetical protein